MGVVATIEHWECTHPVSVIDYFERAPNVNSPKAKWTNFLSSPKPEILDPPLGTPIL